MTDGFPPEINAVVFHHDRICCSRVNVNTNVFIYVNINVNVEVNAMPVKEYVLSEEERLEVIRKYGPPKMPLRERRNICWTWTSLTLPRYKKFQTLGLNDKDIMKRFNLTEDGLLRMKRQWGLKR